MTKFGFSIAVAGVTSALALAAAIPAAWAGGNRAYLSATGTGATCSSAFPCGDMTDAVAAAGTGGEVICLNAGPYSGVTISQSVTISCKDGWWEAPAAVITISTPAGAYVVIEGLVLDGNGFEGAAVKMQGQGTLDIRNSRVGNNISNGTALLFAPVGPATLLVRDSVFYESGSPEDSGITGGVNIVPAAGITAVVSIERSQMAGNRYGLVADGRSGGAVHATISDSVASGNFADGIVAISSGSQVQVAVDQTRVAGNVVGLAASGSGAAISARNTTVFNNGTGLFTQNNGSLYTYGTNSVSANTTNGAFTHTLALQ